MMLTIVACSLGKHVDVDGVAKLAINGNVDCTAFKIKGTDFYITAGHCVGGTLEIVIGEKRYPVEVLVNGQNTDVAVLLVPGTPGKGLLLAHDPPEPGDEIIAVGYLDMYDKPELHMTRGTISFPANDGRIKMDVTLHGGMSGGPVLSDHGVVTIISNGYWTRSGYVELSPSFNDLRAALFEALSK